MKRQHLVCAMLFISMFLFALTSCSGYSAIMRNHLSNEENYASYTGVVCEIYYYDAQDHKVSLLSAEEIPQCDAYMELTFSDRDSVSSFLGGEPNPDWDLDEFQFSFIITKECNQILAENGFYDTVAVDTPIIITASSFIYMDTDFFFIAALACKDKQYLTAEEGLQSIRAYVNENKSWL